MNSSYKFLAISAVIIVGGIISAFVFLYLAAPPADRAGKEIRLVINRGTTADEAVTLIAERLKKEKFIRSELLFEFAVGFGGIAVMPGAYRVTTSNVFSLAKAFQEPTERWVVIPEGVRKEEIGEVLAERFQWNSKEQKEWKEECATYPEGTYFPDSYLLAAHVSPCVAAKILHNKFNEKLAEYHRVLLAENIKWDTALVLASIVQREASGEEDMPLIAGILWNRLLKGMRLEVDATVQYAIGNEENSWWPQIKTENKSIDSPYNTYRYKGLPPQPISNPGDDAIKAVISPEKTDCLFYLHDSDGNIYCSETLSGHQQNIERYLK